MKNKPEIILKGNRILWFPFFIFCLMVFGCRKSEEKDIFPIQKPEKSTPVNVEVFGYRFKVEGDFNGDGKTETLTEHYFDGTAKTETSKFRTDLEYGDQVDWTMKKNPQSFVLSSDNKMDTLRIASGGQIFGLSYLKNEGDLNEDGSDEISYVIDYADFSNLNSWHIVTHKNGKWKELFAFDIWDWQLPALPTGVSHHGLFGQDGKMAIPDHDEINRQIEDSLKAFPGLVKKMGKFEIQAIFRNEDASEDTMTVNLRTMKVKRRVKDWQR